MSDVSEMMWCKACALFDECDCAGREVAGWIERREDDVQD